MQNVSKLHEIPYVSQLAADAPIRVLADIAVKSRSTNFSRNITGLLVFDGMRFCQQIEGTQTEVAALMDLIRCDTRHTKIEILQKAPLAERRFKRCSLGHKQVEDVVALERLERLKRLQGQADVDAFVAMLSSLDLDGRGCLH